MSETAGRPPLETDSRGRKILKHNRWSYGRGCRCGVCTADHTAYMKEKRGPRRMRVTESDRLDVARTASLSDGIDAAVEAARGETPRGAWIREAVLEKLEREGVTVTDEARRPAPRRRNLSERQAGEGGLITAAEAARIAGTEPVTLDQWRQHSKGSGR